MATQRQDLVLFSDQSVIPTVTENDPHRLFLITSTHSSGPQWLINALVETHTKGSSYSLNGNKVGNSSNSSSSNSSSSNSSSSRSTFSHSITNLNKVTIISFVHNENHYLSSFQKLQINSNQYTVIDCLTDFVQKQIPKFMNNKLALLQSITDQLTNDIPNNNHIVILDQPEFLLSLVSGLTSNELWNNFINPIWQKCKILMINNNVDLFKGGILNSTVNKTFTEFQRFITICHHKSTVVLNLRPLTTGHAKDVTGTLRITRGGVDWFNNSNTTIHVVENEYLYLTEKENTKLFYG
ncbi:hypothetical protein RI543_002173 [Arxiozyma heterogenica]|uniref:Elongator complex protein 6 n=1 Tax=Arxiozyma heterogenica TaxID=278026 RepID=A0AAN8A8N4_9SACH|nr:hypothetical protein RI543_002173 [Kazachstania heterogenica]